MKTHSHYNNTEAKRLWEDSKKALQEELDDFRNRLEEIKQEEINLKELAKYERRKELENHLAGLRLNEQKNVQENETNGDKV